MSIEKLEQLLKSLIRFRTYCGAGKGSPAYKSINDTIKSVRFELRLLNH